MYQRRMRPYTAELCYLRGKLGNVSIKGVNDPKALACVSVGADKNKLALLTDQVPPLPKVIGVIPTRHFSLFSLK